MKRLMFAVVVAVLAAGCSSSPEKGTVASSGEIEREWVEEGITKNYIFARGIGAADQTLENKTQRIHRERPVQYALLHQGR